MARHGIQISQQGVPVERAADYQKVLDSNWKFLDIHEEVMIDTTIVLSAGADGWRLNPIYTHNLKYVAAFEFFPSKECSGGGMLNGPMEALKFIKGDDKYIYCAAEYFAASPASHHTIRLKGMLRVFALNILEEYQAPTIPAFSNTVQPPSRYGAKFIDKHKGIGNINDESMYPFTLNTRGKQMSVHKHGSAVANTTLTITHNVGYPPSYLLCLVEEQESWADTSPYPYDTPYVVGGLVSAYYAAEVDETTIEFIGVQSSLGTRRYGYIILKDPAEIAG